MRPARGPLTGTPYSAHRHRGQRSGTALWCLPGSISVLGGYADRGLRRLCPRRSHHVAGVRVIVGLPGSPARDHSDPGRQHRRVRVVPDGPGRRSAVRCPRAAGHRRGRGDRGARRGADRPATGRQRARACRQHRGYYLWPGLAAGALGASGLVQYGPAPTHLVWLLLLGAFSAAIAGILVMRESAVRRPGVLASLRPRVKVPPRARGTFAVAVPCRLGGAKSVNSKLSSLLRGGWCRSSGRWYCLPTVPALPTRQSRRPNRSSVSRRA